MTALPERNCVAWMCTRLPQARVVWSRQYNRIPRRLDPRRMAPRRRREPRRGCNSDGGSLGFGAMPRARASETTIPEELRIDAAGTVEILVDVIREEVRRAGFTKAVLGLSGGIDSAVSAALAARALGARNVLS